MQFNDEKATLDQIAEEANRLQAEMDRDYSQEQKQLSRIIDKQGVAALWQIADLTPEQQRCRDLMKQVGDLLWRAKSIVDPYNEEPI